MRSVSEIVSQIKFKIDTIHGTFSFGKWKNAIKRKEIHRGFRVWGKQILRVISIYNIFNYICKLLVMRRWWISEKKCYVSKYFFNNASIKEGIIIWKCNKILGISCLFPFVNMKEAFEVL